MALSYKVCRQQDDLSTSSVIQHFISNSDFNDVAEFEKALILRRDKEDDEKLASGIQKAIAKGVIPEKVDLETVTKISVQGKSGEEVADEIIKSAGDKGGILVLTGLSGTGKGTTVAKMQAKLSNAVTWSNGNLFRSITLLAVTAAEQKGIEFSQLELTPELLQEFMGYLTFDKFDGKFDTAIKGLGIDVRVSEVQNTLLKEPRISKAIPAVAEYTQGEVINFASKAAQRMSEDGVFVIMEGREQTLQYVRTPLRYVLTLDDTSVIGQRQAALKLLSNTLKKISTEVEGLSEAEQNTKCEATMHEMLATMVASVFPERA